MTVTARAFSAVRLVWWALPRRVRQTIEDRFFVAVGHATRVTNDGYPQPEPLIPPAGKGARTEGGVPEHERRKKRTQ